LYCKSFHNQSITEIFKKVKIFLSKVIDKHKIILYDVSIVSHSKIWQGDRNMAKIINFLEAKERLDMAGLVSALKAKQEIEKEPEKGPVFISALPDEAIPAEYPDFRPLLQRDGLILLGWSFWDKHPARGTGFEVNWITSAPNHRRYSSSLIKVKDPMDGVKPAGLGNPFFSEGLYGRYNYPHQIPAKYVILCAPSDLNSRNIPAFVELLKASGLTVDFDYRFSLGGQKELEYKREQEDLTARLNGLQGAKNNG
jgi:hypothetical protein